MVKPRHRDQNADGDHRAGDCVAEAQQPLQGRREARRTAARGLCLAHGVGDEQRQGHGEQRGESGEDDAVAGEAQEMRAELRVPLGEREAQEQTARQRKAEEARQAELRRQEEERRIEEQKRQEELKKQEEQKRLAEEKRKAEEKAEAERKAKQEELKKQAQERERKIAEEKAQREKALAEKRKAQEELNRQRAQEQANAARRKEMLSRLTGQSGSAMGSGSGAMTNFQQAQYNNRIVACIRPHITFNTPAGAKRGMYVAKFDVRLLKNGQKAVPPKMISSSGLKAFDTAVEKAILMCNPFPKPPVGDIPSSITLTFDPVDDANGR